MTTIPAHRSAILPFELGEARAHAGLTLVPLLPRDEPKLEYIGLDEALARGASVREVDTAGAVEELVFDNPLGELVLLYEGEELVGAKQNRIVQRTALVGGRAVTSLPVHCVEQGRWAYRTRVFSSAPRTAGPEVRRAKGSQGAVWAAVAAKNERLGVHAPTGAAEDAYLAHAPSLDEYLHALPRLDRQCGGIAGIGGVVACLDYVGRADVFAGLYAKLLRGYALDAIEGADAPSVRRGDVVRFLRAVTHAPRRLAPAVALGAESRFPFGIELSAHGELVSLSAFPA